MIRDRAPQVGAGLALVVLLLLVVLDLSVAPEYAVLTALFSLPPLIACAVVPVPGTAVISSAGRRRGVRLRLLERGHRRHRPAERAAHQRGPGGRRGGRDRGRAGPPRAQVR